MPRFKPRPATTNKGKDTELQKPADEIIAGKEKEIAFMNDWLKKHEKPETKAKAE